MSNLESELSVGLEAVAVATKFAEKVRAAADDRNNMIKSDCSPVTMADFGVQAIVHRYLANHFPTDPIVAEEDSQELAENTELLDRIEAGLNEVDDPWGRDEIMHHLELGGHSGGPAGRFWTLDPIDGTKGFIRGDQYAIALALIENGRPILGILGCPHLEMALAAGGDSRRGWIFAAGDGEPFAKSVADQVKQPIRVSGVTDTAGIRLCESFESGHSSHGTSAIIAKELGVHLDPLRMDSQAKYAGVAAGMADTYLRLPTRKEYREKIWDHAAGVYILEKAGGKVSDVLGQDLDFSQGRTLANNRGVIAATAGVHAEVVEKVKPHFAE